MRDGAFVRGGEAERAMSSSTGRAAEGCDGGGLRAALTRRAEASPGRMGDEG